MARILLKLKSQITISYCFIKFQIVGIGNSRESEFPPTRRVFSVGAISESRHLPLIINLTRQ